MPFKANDGSPDIASGSHARRVGFNIIGYVSANAGVAVSLRSFVRLLLELGHPVAILDVDPGLNRGDHDQTFQSYAVSRPEDLPFEINLVCVFMHRLTDFVLENSEWLLRRDRLNVCLVWWELPVFPHLWVQTLQFFDVVMGASSFVKSALDNALSSTWTIQAVHPLYLPHDASPCRSRFNLPADRVLFLTSFEPHSDPVRKNGLAAIDAFEKAFPHDDAVGLVVKLNNPDAPGTVRPALLVDDLVARSKRDPRLRIISETLDYGDNMRLYASCDVFLSLHRAEGFGLSLIESMKLGKPVIATAWSGNMTFMDHTNSCPVSYDLIPPHGFYEIYRRGFLPESVVWADPHIDDAAAWMRLLAADPALRDRVGRTAKDSIGELQRTAQRGDFVREIEAIRDNAINARERDAKRQRSLDKVRAAEAQHVGTAMRHSRRPTQSSFRRALERHILWRFHSK